MLATFGAIMLGIFVAIYVVIAVKNFTGMLTRVNFKKLTPFFKGVGLLYLVILAVLWPLFFVIYLVKRAKHEHKQNPD